MQKRVDDKPKSKLSLNDLQKKRSQQQSVGSPILNPKPLSVGTQPLEPKPISVVPPILDPKPISTENPTDTPIITRDSKRHRKPGPSKRSPFKERAIKLNTKLTPDEEMLSEWLFHLKGEIWYFNHI